tara:strand:+ start:428 stop:892 length:465 start_codon:yes stop_codon:yes gene_type:complete
MTFFKETKTEFNLLSKKALEKIYENIVNNSKGTKSGVTRTALKEAGYSKEEIDEKMNTKKRDPKSVLMLHLQEVWVAQRGRCKYSKLPMDEKFLFTGDQNINGISPERKRNKEGYVLGNIRLVLRGINKMRGPSKPSEFKDFLKKVSTSVVENI